MTVITEESVCFDCKGKETCQRIKRLGTGKTIRDEIEQIYESAKKGEIDTSTLLMKIGGEYRKRGKEIFEILVVNCSMKVQYNERKRIAREAELNPPEHADFRYLFYCTVCNKMHITGSGIGKEHKKIMDEKRKEVENGKNIESKGQSKTDTQTI